ncbi:MAG TPA: sugar phosphate isomerase [Firmicutes bacterium]|nr:sugar phosphate isomerase [Bacillota bacterium]
MITDVEGVISLIKQLGISSWSYPWAIGVPGYPIPKNPLTAVGLLEKAKTLGVDVVQIADNLPLHRLSTAELEELRNTADEYGIKLEIGTRGVQPEHLRQYLAITKFLNSGLLRTLTHTVESQPDLAQIEAWLREVLPDFAAAGVVIALENYERHSAAELADLIRKIDHPALGVCLDTVNNFGALEGPEVVLNTLAPYVLNLHIKDFAIARIDTAMGYLVTGKPAGEGRLNVPDVIELLNQNNRAINIILELWPPYQNSVEATIQNEAEWVERSITYLKSALKQARS